MQLLVQRALESGLILKRFVKNTVIFGGNSKHLFFLNLMTMLIIHETLLTLMHLTYLFLPFIIRKLNECLVQQEF